MKKDFLVSVVMPIKNAERTIVRALDSVLNQSYKNSEIILVDDDSTDKTRDLIKKFKNRKIKLIKNKKSLGPAASRNKGIKRAKGEIVFFTDSDCEVPRNWIETILKEYKDEKIAGVGGYLKPGKNNLIAKLELLQNRFILKIKNRKIIGKASVPMGYTNNVSYRRKILGEINGFDENFPFPAGEDVDLKKRVCEKGYFVVYIPFSVKHLDSYDSSYLFNRLIMRGLNVSPPENKTLKILFGILTIPIIVLGIAKKMIKYKFQRLI